MSWTWVWIGGALVLGFHLGVTLMSLLVMSRDSQSDDGLASPRPEGKSMLNRGSPVAAAGSAVRAGDVWPEGSHPGQRCLGGIRRQDGWRLLERQRV